MKRTLLLSALILGAFFIFAGDLTIYLEDMSQTCELFVNGASIGQVSDSFVMKNVQQGVYKVSMFSTALHESGMNANEDLLTETDKKAKALDEEKMKTAIALGTETVFVSQSQSKVTIKNKQVFDILKEKKSGGGCCLGGGCLGIGGGCLLVGGVVLGGAAIVGGIVWLLISLDVIDL